MKKKFESGLKNVDTQRREIREFLYFGNNHEGR